MQECVIHIWVSARKMLLLGVSNGVTTILRWYSFLFQIWCLTLNLIIGARTHTLSMGSNEWFYARIVKLHCLCTSDVIVLHQTWYNLFVMNGKKAFRVTGLCEGNEDTFTTYELQTWLPDFILGMDRFRNLTACVLCVEVTGYIGNKTKISSLSIDRQLKFQITAWQKWEIKPYKMGISPQSTQAVISLQWRCLRESTSHQKGSVMQSFDIFFDISLNKLLNKLVSCLWLELPWCSCDITVMLIQCSQWPVAASSLWKWIQSKLPLNFNGTLDNLQLTSQ